MRLLLPPDLERLPADTRWRGQTQGSLRSGVWHATRADGQLVRELSYRRGELHGPGLAWSETGALVWHGHFVEGRRWGRHAWWGEAGECLGEVNFVADLPHGLARWRVEAGWIQGLADAEGNVQRWYRCTDGRPIEAVLPWLCPADARRAA